MLVPKLRFKEFEDSWTIDELGNFVDINSGDSPSKFKMLEKGIPYFKVEQLNNCYKYQDNTIYHIIIDKPIKKGSIIFPKRGAAILLNKIRILKYDSYIDTNLMSLTTHNINNEFLYYYLLKSNLSNIADTSSIPQINNKHILPYKIRIPALKEQCKISKTLSLLDQKIELQQRKIEVLKMYKRGLMKKILNNITDSNLIKLKDIYKFTYGEGNTNPDNGGIYPVYGANGIIGGFDRYNAEESVIIGHMGAYAGNVLFEKNKHFVTYNGTIAIPKDVNKLRPKFGYYILLNANLPKICAGSGMPFLSYETLNNIKVKLPNIEIQQKYEKIFDNIEIKICNEEKKLIYLNELKKSLLQKMFI